MRGGCEGGDARGAASGLRKGLRPLTRSRDWGGDFCILFPRVYAGVSPLRRRPKGKKTDERLRSPFGNLRFAPMFVEPYRKFFLVSIPSVFPKQRYKIRNMGVRPEGVKGATADFVCFHCPLVASAEAKPSATIKDCCFFRQPALIFLPIWSLPYFQRAKKTNEVRDRPLDSFGGRLPCRLNCIGRLFSYWQGRFAACALLAVPFE